MRYLKLWPLLAIMYKLLLCDIRIKDSGGVETNRHVDKLVEALPEVHRTEEVKAALMRAFYIAGNLWDVWERHYGGDEMGGGSGMGRPTLAFSGTEDECYDFIDENASDSQKETYFTPDGPRFYVNKHF